MYLNFRRTIASTRRCTFDECETPTERLRDVSRTERFNALKFNKIYIPHRARVCSNHVSQNTWVVNTEGNMLFSSKQVNDLIELFSTEEIGTTGLNFTQETCIILLTQLFIVYSYWPKQW